MLELNNLPTIPEQYETELVDKLMLARPELLRVSQMSMTERFFLNGLVRLFKPKNVLEIGVHHGGGTNLILNALHDVPEAKVTSIDIADSVEIGKTVPQAERHNWTLITGKDPVEVIEELDGAFDFMVLDTAHVHPIESLNFLTAFPFLTEDAVVVLHDISLFTAENMQFPSIPFASKLLFDVVTARKLEPCSKVYGRSNIGAFQLMPYSKDHIDDIFSMLSFPWGLELSRNIEFERFFKKYYSEKANYYYRKAAELHQITCVNECGFFPAFLCSNSEVTQIKNRFEEILKKSDLYFMVQEKPQRNCFHISRSTIFVYLTNCGMLTQIIRIVSIYL